MGKKDNRNKWQEKINNHWEIYVLLIFLAGYYMYEMITNLPWYDELYTYYTFISKGPVYSAIHWPLPNNHIGFSVVSSLLNFIGSSLISLRGVSYICACLNVILLENVIHKYFIRVITVVVLILYVCANEVNVLSIQGRGYTSAVTCYLLALLCCEKIVRSTVEVKKRYYWLFAASLAMGLYILPSSVYWVLPVCITGGICLLMLKQYKCLGKLILFSLLAAAGTFFLYSIVWLAVGSNLISKNPDSVYYGLYQVKIILKQPLQAFQTGMESMLHNPYVASIDRTTVLNDILPYLRDNIFESFYRNCGLLVLIILPVNMVFAVLSLLRRNKEMVFLCCYVLVSIVMMPTLLILQSVLPYTRVMSFFMVTVAISIGLTVQMIGGFINSLLKGFPRRGMLVQGIGMGLCLFLGMFFLLSPLRGGKCANEEIKVYELLEASHIFEDKDINIKDRMDSCFYTDDLAKYVLKYYYQAMPEEKPYMDAHYIIMRNELMERPDEALHWPVLACFTQEEIDEIKEQFIIVSSNDCYTLFKKR